MNNRLSIRKVVLLSLFLAVPFFLTGCSLKSSTSSNQKTQTLTIWRLDTDKQAFESVISAYEQKNPTVSVNYRIFSPSDDYETAVINALAAGNGPDIWEIQNDELPRHKDKLVGFDLTDTQLKAFKKTFAPALAEELIDNNKIYGMPIGIDPLVLFINNDHFEQASLTSAPKTWAEAFTDANTLTAKIDTTIVRPGFALGLASNIDRASQILQLLMLQYSTQMTDSAHHTATFDLFVQEPESGQYLYPGKNAFAHYASFADPKAANFSWDKTQPYSTLAFAQGNLSMMINYLSLVPQIKQIAPKLNFSVSRVPQLEIKRFPVGDLPGSVSDPVYTAKYRALVVSKPSLKLSKQRGQAQVQLAKQFIGYVTNTPDVVALYTSKTNTMTPRILDAGTNGTGTDAAAVVINPYLRSWYKGPSPRLVDGVFQQLIADITENGTDLNQAFSKAAQNVTSILR